MENWKPGKGFLAVKVIIFMLLLVEVILVGYYVKNYEILGTNFSGLSSLSGAKISVFQVLGVLTICVSAAHFSYKYISSFYKIISRMYPFTIILFSLFLATLYSEKKAVNENKTQHLLERIGKQVFATNSYDGKEEYPLVRQAKNMTGLNEYFNFKATKPTIKIIIVDGLGSSFINDDGIYTGFMPNLSALKNESLYWPNFLSNTGEGHAALPTIIGSLPFGENGFTHISNLSHRNTLFSILEKNGYRTSFTYGGNSALDSYDKFLNEEGVDLVLDKKTFGKDFVLQDKDAAGISLGYPDKELFKKYHNELPQDTIPRLDVLFTLSTKEPFLIPKLDHYSDKVETLLLNNKIQGKERRIINKNKSLFASFLYADEAILEYMKVEKKLPNFENTIYIITGSHYATALPQQNELSRYRVPLFIYSQLLKSGQTQNELASHADIAPALLSSLQLAYKIEVPYAVAWLGDGLNAPQGFSKKKQIPLLRSTNNIQDFILGANFLTDGEVYTLDKNLNFTECENEEDIEFIEEKFEYFKAVNEYVTSEDKILPKPFSLLTHEENEFTKEQKIWIQSVFNGKDFDEAYRTARNLAIDKEWERALLLCRYILNEIPRHVDTEILMGRLYAWQEKYEKSTTILEKVIQEYPEYEDGYCALLDTYFWSDNDENVFRIRDMVKKNSLTQKLLVEKIIRSIEKIKAKKSEELEEQVSRRQSTLAKTTQNER